MNADFHTAVLARPCPTCKAREGWECSDTSGRRATTPHSPRFNLAVIERYKAFNKKRFNKKG